MCTLPFLCRLQAEIPWSQKVRLFKARVKGLVFTRHMPVSRWHDTGLARYVFFPNSWNGSVNCSSSSAFYVNLPLESISREINLEPLGVEVRAVCSNNGFPLLYFKSALWSMQRNSLFRIGDVAAVLDNTATRGHLCRMKMPKKNFSCFHLLLWIKWCHRRQSTLSNLSPFGQTFFLLVMADRYWRKTRLRKLDFQWELRSQIWHVSFIKNCKTQVMLDLITVAL